MLIGKVCVLRTDLSRQQLQFLQFQWKMPEIIIHFPTCIPVPRENTGWMNKSGAGGRRFGLMTVTVHHARPVVQAIYAQTHEVALRDLNFGRQTLWEISVQMLLKWPLSPTNSAFLSGLFCFTTRKAQSWKAVGATEMVHFNPRVLQMGFCLKRTAVPFTALQFWSQRIGVIQQGLIILIWIPVSRTSICRWRWGFRDGAGPVVQLVHRQLISFWGSFRETWVILPTTASQTRPGISWARSVAWVQDSGG